MLGSYELMIANNQIKIANGYQRKYLFINIKSILNCYFNQMRNMTKYL